jgi:hypothetical protein
MEPHAPGPRGRGADGRAARQGLPAEGGEDQHSLFLRGGLHGHLLPPPQSGVLLVYSEGRANPYWGWKATLALVDLKLTPFVPLESLFCDALQLFGIFLKLFYFLFPQSFLV